MTTLVTGATGYLGSAVVERLLATGGRGIRCLVRPNSATIRLKQLQAQYGQEAVTLTEGNLVVERDVARALSGIERVVHLAASMRGAPADMFLNTVVGTKRLLDGMAHSDVKRVVLVSSLAVYGLSSVSPGQLVTEDTPLDSSPERRDVYTHTKIRQEALLRALPASLRVACIAMRIGPVYGRSGPEFSSRIGLSLPGLLLQLGGDNALPLSYIDNCAEAVCRATMDERFTVGEYNVFDENLPTAGEYLRRYRLEVRRIRSIRLPFAATLLLSRLVERYHAVSKGQIPQVLTPYRAKNVWGGHVYDNGRLKRTGWVQLVSTEDALRETFSEFRARLKVNGATPARGRHG